MHSNGYSADFQLSIPRQEHKEMWCILQRVSPSLTRQWDNHMAGLVRNHIDITVLYYKQLSKYLFYHNRKRLLYFIIRNFVVLPFNESRNNNELFFIHY